MNALHAGLASEMIFGVSTKTHDLPVDTVAPSVGVSRPKTNFAVEALLLLLCVILVRFQTFSIVAFDPDENVFGLAAREVFRGHLPYLSLFDIKPVGSSMLLAGAYHLFGESIFTLRLVGLLCVWTSAVLLAVLLRRNGRPVIEQRLAAFFYVAYVTSVGGLGTMTEVMLAPFTIACILSLDVMLKAERARLRLLMAAFAGLSCGFATLIKLVPIVPGSLVAAVVLLILFRQKQVQFGSAIILGSTFGALACLPMLIAALVYDRVGELPSFLYANFGFAQAYVLQRRSTTHIAKDLIYVIMVLGPLILLSIINLLKALRPSIDPKRRSLTLIAFFWLTGELIAASIPQQYFVHYFIMVVPPLTILAASTVELFPRLGDLKATKTRLVMAGYGAIILLPIIHAHSMIGWFRNYIPNTQQQVPARILALTNGKAPDLFVTSDRYIVLYSLLRADLPTRYAIPAHLFSNYNTLIRIDPAKELARILSKRPEFIVTEDSQPLPAGAHSQLQFALTARYDRVIDDGPIHVYRLQAQ